MTDLSVQKEPSPAPLALTPNKEQIAAVDSMLQFLSSKHSFFILEGGAGTGKTYCIRLLVNKIKGRIIFTAPTNKAVRVIRRMFSEETYRPECATIFSLLKLQLKADGDVKSLAGPSNPVDLSMYKVVVLDEGSMANKKLIPYLKHAADAGVKFICMMDLAQLPPVKEPITELLKLKDEGTTLTKVMRYDNQLLKLATELRGKLSHPAPSITFKEDNADGMGIFVRQGKAFQEAIRLSVRAGAFGQPDRAKIVAWRNDTVLVWNSIVRQFLFDEASTSPWLVEDRITLLEPAQNLEGEFMAMTDEEGKVVAVDIDYHPVWPEFKIWRIKMLTDDGEYLQLFSLHEDSTKIYSQQLEAFRTDALADRRRWHLFWEFKEAFHSLRHAYAGTAHRAQGSTYETVFVDWRDILANYNRQEAFKCLYVACTRASKRLILN